MSIVEDELKQAKEHEAVDHSFVRDDRIESKSEPIKPPTEINSGSDSAAQKETVIEPRIIDSKTFRSIDELSNP